MELLVISLFLAGGIAAGSGVDGVDVPAPCPADYRRRVETCVMEAQVAPQAGGGLSLVVNNDTIVHLCERGLLRKTIDCLEEIRSRCAHNTTIATELDRLYSVSDWQQGAQLLCEDTDFFLANQECLSECTTSVMTCVLFRTQIFRMGLTFTDPSDTARIREVTCNFAESIVKCVRTPLREHCPIDMVRRVAGGMYLFLPPFCHTDNYITVTQRPPPTVTEEGRKKEEDFEEAEKWEDSEEAVNGEEMEKVENSEELEKAETSEEMENVETSEEMEKAEFSEEMEKVEDSDAAEKKEDSEETEKAESSEEVEKSENSEVEKVEDSD